MAVTETLRALGSWGLTLKPTLSDEVWKAIDYFGHIAVHVGRSSPPLDDSLLRSARYVGPITTISDRSVGKRTIGGQGMALWLGDPEGKGDVFKDPLVLNGDFDDVIRAALPASGSVIEGTIFNVPETFSNTFQFQTPRDVIDYICQTLDAGWRVNGDGTLDAGLISDLFEVNPKCVVVRKKLARTVASADDMFLRGLAGMAETERDVKDYTTDVLLLAQGINGQFVQAEANTPIGEIPFLDIHGNKVKFERIVQESETDAGNAPARAQLQLNRFKGTRDALTLNTSNYDIKGQAQVGDYLWVYDPIMELVDINNEVLFRGERVNPFRLRLTEMTWPITSKMSVFYRSGTGEWFDLTGNFEPETGDTSLVVGGYNRSLTDGGSGAFPVVPDPESDTTVPGQVSWDTPWLQAQYQSPITGETRSEVEMKWLRPDNTDTTTITDGAYYEIRFRQSNTPLANYTIDELAEYELDELNTVEEPIVFGAEQEWQYARAPFEVLKFRLQELTPGVTYEAQIRAVDTARPPHLGDWSDLLAWQASRDIFPPATPAAPVIAASPMAVLMTHNLGRADGGEFNLDRDLGHLELHGSVDPLFSVSTETLIGKTPADWGMISGEVPLVASFQITETVPMYYKVVAVDHSGNKSLPSAAAVATAELIDDQWVRNLRVDKITAGTISADWIIGAYIRTGKTGSRVEMSSAGISGYNHLNLERLRWDSASGQLQVIGTGGIKVTGGGNVEITDGAVIVYNAAGRKIIELGECADGRHGLQVYKDNGTRVTRVGELASGSEGIETISDLGALVRVDTLAFGTKAATVTAGQTTTSTSFTDLATPGPVQNADVGNSGRLLIVVSSGIQPATGHGGIVGFDMVGPGGYFSAANFLHSVWFDSSGSGISSASKVFLVTGLPQAGNYTAALKYRSQAGGSINFFDRHLIMIPF